MSDIVERLLNISRGGHERGCDGRSYTCSCGYDDVNEKTAEDAAAEIQRLRAEVERLTLKLEDAGDEGILSVCRVLNAVLETGQPVVTPLEALDKLGDRILSISPEASERAAQIAEAHLYIDWSRPRNDQPDPQPGRVIAAAIRQAGKDGGAG